MELTQPASQGPAVLEEPKDSNREEGLGGNAAKANPDDGSLVDPAISAVITDEVLRHRVRLLIDDKPEPSTLQRLLAHPLAAVVLSFLLTGLVGGLLTYYYTSKQKELEFERGLQQQELARQRSFSDELNRIRVQKIGEVWEHVDKTEVTLDSLLEKANKARTMDKKDFDIITSVIDEDVAVINKNRFWLGKQTYNRIKDYLDINGRYALDMLLGQPGIDLSETLKRREQAKQDVLQIREMFLKGEPDHDKQPARAGQ